MQDPIVAGIPRSTSGAIQEIDVLWITAGLGCDGDTIAMTAATQPSIEDIIHGQIPWIPKVRLYLANYHHARVVSRSKVTWTLDTMTRNILVHVVPYCAGVGISLRLCST
jgi:hypothetical protein